MFVVCDAFDAAISSIPKCGSQSVEGAVTGMRGGRIIENEEAMNYDTRVMFIRDPIVRLHSNFSFFWWLEFNGADYFSFIPKGILTGQRGSEDIDYKNFIDYALDNPDPHWGSQVDLMTFNGEFIPTHIHKFEDIQEHWEKYAAGRLPWYNAWSRIPITDYRQDDIKSFYQKDIAMRDSL